MSDYGSAIVNDAERGNEAILEGEWEFDDETFSLEVKNIAQPDMALIREYAALAGQVQMLADDPENVDESDVEQVSEQAENLDNFSWEGDDSETDFILSVVDEKLVKPKVNVQETSEPVLTALMEGMMKTWQESTDVQAAKEAMPLEGNR
jgi:hypothetical protein